MKVFWNNADGSLATGTVVQWVASGKDAYAIVLQTKHFNKIPLAKLWTE